MRIQEVRKSDDARRERYRRRILSKAMADHGIDQRRVAQVVGISEKGLSAFFRGATHSLDLAKKLAEAFGVKVEEAYRAVGQLPPVPD